MKIEKEMVSARGSLPISFLHAHTISKLINRKKFGKAKEFLSNLVDEKTSIRGRYYTSTSKNLLELLNSAESNAVARNIDPFEMQLLISVHKGPTLYRGRRKREFGLKLKRANVQVVLKPIKRTEKKEEKKVE